ncbi:hypothetical protein HZB03_03560 [Candidatus Woesearchaeota archaeon]|nr:hypothetical protein [Candidatus Woesearchaeota archaeon]
MVHPLIGIHAAIGELGVLAFLWVFVELLNPTEPRIKRAKIAAALGTLFFLASWVAGGYYYVTYYGPAVKPVIKSGPAPWAHGVVMEVKEHVFLFLPFLSALTTGLVYRYKNNLIKDAGARTSVLLLCALIVIVGLLMAGMGYIISTGARAALEGKIA